METDKRTNSRKSPRGSSLAREIQGRLAHFLLFLCAMATVFTAAGIIVVLGVETARFFSRPEVSAVDFFLGVTVDPDAKPPRFGLLPLLWGTAVITAGSCLVALPIGLMSAVFLSEYAPRKLRAFLKPTLEILAGVPTIVYGYLAVVLVTPFLRKLLEPFEIRVETYNVVSACVVVGVMIIPMVSSLSEDVISSVPRSLREAAHGLGATKFEVTTRIVLPASLSGIVASFILAVSRAVGETMAVVLAAGSTPKITLNPFTSVETMTAYIVAVVGGEASFGSTEHLSLFAVGASLFAITLSLNLISSAVPKRAGEAD